MAKTHVGGAGIFGLALSVVDEPGIGVRATNKMGIAQKPRVAGEDFGVDRILSNSLFLEE